MGSRTAYEDFTERLKLLISKHPVLITTTLSNIFTMRLIGNKTHGDLGKGWRTGSKEGIGENEEKSTAARGSANSKGLFHCQ